MRDGEVLRAKLREVAEAREVIDLLSTEALRRGELVTFLELVEVMAKLDGRIDKLVRMIRRRERTLKAGRR